MIDWILTARLAVGVAATVTVSIVVGMFAIARWQRRTHRLASQTADATRTSLDALVAEMAQLAAANLALREYLTSLSERVDRPVALPQSAAPTGRAYELAARLAAGGAASDDLVTNCGLTPAEATLAVLVHGARSRGEATAH